MHLAVHITFNVVNDIMHELFTQSVIANPLVGIDLRVAADFPQNFALQGIAPHIRHNLGAYFAEIAVKHPHNDTLVHVVALELPTFDLSHSRLLAFVHVGNAATNEGFIYFDRATTFAHLSNRFVLHCQTNSMEHEPCGLLSDLHVAGDLVTTNAILAVSDEPHCSEPLVQSDCGIFHHVPYLDGEFALRMMAGALPSAALLAELNAIRAASWTGYFAVRPAANRQIVNAVVGIAEVQNRFLQALWFFHKCLVHCLNSSLKQWTSQVNYYP